MSSSPSRGRSPRFEPVVIQNEPGKDTNQSQEKSIPISPLVNIVGKHNMILVWTGLALVVFILFVVFYINFSPSARAETSTGGIEGVADIIKSPINIIPVK